MPLRIGPEQKAAYAAFLDDPSEANEQRLAVLADPLLIGKRYALLRRAYAELRCRITAQAAVILKPTVARVREALTAEHNRRLEKTEGASHCICCPQGLPHFRALFRDAGKSV